MEGWGSVARVALTKVGDELISQGGSPPSHTILEWFSASQLVTGLKRGGGGDKSDGTEKSPGRETVLDDHQCSLNTLSNMPLPASLTVPTVPMVIFSPLDGCSGVSSLCASLLVPNRLVLYAHR